MTRTHSFPFDWLAPGERRYCARCGRNLVPRSESACANCRLETAGRSGAPDCDGPAADREAASTHARLEAETERMARDRLEAGVPPLFWVGD